jgi:hypothetical protein
MLIVFHLNTLKNTEENVKLSSICLDPDLIKLYKSNMLEIINSTIAPLCIGTNFWIWKPV